MWSKRASAIIECGSRAQRAASSRAAATTSASPGSTSNAAPASGVKVSAPTTRRIGVANLYRMMRGYDSGGLVGGPPPWSLPGSSPSGSGSTGGVDVNVGLQLSVAVDGKQSPAHTFDDTMAQAVTTGIEKFAKSSQFRSSVHAAIRKAFSVGNGNLQRGVGIG